MPTPTTFALQIFHLITLVTIWVHKRNTELTMVVRKVDIWEAGKEVLFRLRHYSYSTSNTELVEIRHTTMMMRQHLSDTKVIWLRVRLAIVPLCHGTGAPFKKMKCFEGTCPHRRSQGVQWVHLHPPLPQGGEKFLSGLIYRKNVKVHPQPEQESIFRTVFAWWLRFGGIFRRSSGGRRLKKGCQLFWEKSAPQTKSWLRLCPLEML